MSELNPAGAFEEREIVQPANIQLNMHTCMNQRRVAVLRFPYSDMRTLPSQVITYSFSFEENMRFDETAFN